MVVCELIMTQSILKMHMTSFGNVIQYYITEITHNFFLFLNPFPPEKSLRPWPTCSADIGKYTKSVQ